jgi:ketosteroid isomerase-like protein
MKSLLVRSLACACLLLAASPSQTQSEPDAGARTKLLALENIWNNAEKAGDTKALSLILDEAMVYIDEEGALLTKAQFLEQVKREGEHVQALTTEGVGVSVFADTAVVSGTYWVSGEDRGKPFRRAGRFIDTWILRDGAWVCVTAQSTPVLRAGTVNAG